MKKRTLALCLSLAMSATIVGCAPSTDGAESSAPTSAPTSAPEGTSGEKIVVDIWTNDRHDQEYVSAQIAAFNESNDKNIELVQTIVTDDYINMYSMAVTSDTAPDILTMSGGMAGFDMQVFADNGLVLPLDDYIAEAGEEFEKTTDHSKHIYNGLNAVDGVTFWVPTAVRSGTRMLYNVDMATNAGYNEFPNTIEGLVELSKAMTASGNGEFYGYAATSSAPFVRSFEGISEMSGQNRYGYDYVNGKFDFSGFAPIMEAYQPLLAEDSLFPGSATQGVDAMRAQFATGAAGLWANASQEAGVFTDQFPIEGFEWAVAEHPTLDGEIKGALTAQPQKGYMIAGNSDSPDEAFEVIKFLSSEEFLKGYLEEGYALPYSAHMTSVVDAELAGRVADFALTDYESVYPAAPSVTIEGEDYQTVIWSALMGERGIQEAIDDLNTRYNEALERDIESGKVKRLVIKDYDPMQPSAGTPEYLDN